MIAKAGKSFKDRFKFNKQCMLQAASKVFLENKGHDPGSERGKIKYPKQTFKKKNPECIHTVNQKQQAIGICAPTVFPNGYKMA